MISSHSVLAICFSLSSTVFASPRAIPALPAVQYVSPRSDYQGGYPLGLTGSNSGDCPADASVQCASTVVNPSCCPSGQTCFFSYDIGGANYCCPTGTDCLTAVQNFPRCADYSWNMFIQTNGESYFCCPPGTIATNPSAGMSGGLCEPSDQVIPKSLLATLVSQVGAPTPTPSATTTAASSNATATSAPSETNPSLPGAPGTETSSGSSTTSTGSSDTIHLNHTARLSIGLGVVAIFVFLVFCGVVAMCRRNRRLRVIEKNNFQYNAGYDRFGNPLAGYTGPMGAYEPYRRVDTPAPNNVTVNVVQGDLQGDGARL